jgi:hypothetical protein
VVGNVEQRRIVSEHRGARRAQRDEYASVGAKGLENIAAPELSRDRAFALFQEPSTERRICVERIPQAIPTLETLDRSAGAIQIRSLKPTPWTVSMPSKPASDRVAVEFAARRQDEDRRSTHQMPAHGIEDLETVGAGQAEVEDDQVVTLGADAGHCRRSVMGEVDDETAELEKLMEVRRDRRVVLHDQKLRRAGGGGFAIAGHWRIPRYRYP